jgi:uncharacterized protein
MSMDIEYLNEDDLKTLYGPPGDVILRAIKHRLVDFHIEYLKKATFFVIATGNDSGLDASPRGGSAGIVHVIDPQTIAFADWPGNNRIESLRNIVKNDKVGLLFIFPGIDIFMRINGRAGVTVNPVILDSLLEGTRRPKTAVVIKIDDVLFHCGKAISRAGLWDPANSIDRKSLPSAGIMMKELAQLPDVDPEELDEHYRHSVKHDLYDAHDEGMDH